MKTLKFRNADEMPMLGLGTWKSEPGQVAAAVTRAIEIGYRHIDCAPIYGNEAEIGNALKDVLSATISRDQLWITSKLWNCNHLPEDVEPALEKTLQDLQLEYLDLYLIHWPVHHAKGVLFPSSADEYLPFAEIPVTETWAALESLVKKGRIRHIGVCNFSVAKLEQISASATISPEMNQIELHPYLQQPQMLNFCNQNGIHLTAYSPLGSADRPARLKSEDEPVLLAEPVIATIAKQHSLTPAQVLLAWGIERGTAVIPKSVNQQRLKENFAAHSISLSAADISQIGGLNKNRRYVSGEFWTGSGSPYTLERLWDE